MGREMAAFRTLAITGLGVGTAAAVAAGTAAEWAASQPKDPDTGVDRSSAQKRVLTAGLGVWVLGYSAALMSYSHPLAATALGAASIGTAVGIAVPTLFDGAFN
jgi:hypothetical protein